MGSNRKERLKLLFEDDPSLLYADTGLNKSTNTPSRSEGKLKGDITEEQAREALKTATIISGRDPKNTQLREEENIDHPKPPHDGDVDFEVPDAPLAACFCPVLAITRLPYKYIRNQGSDLIAKQFFDGGKIWARGWDLYYIYPPEDISTRPLLLMSAVQVQSLIDDINEHFHCSLSIPIDRRLGLILPFVKDGTPEPVFLGQCTSKETKDELELTIPSPWDDTEQGNPSADENLQNHPKFNLFRAKMQAGVEATKRRTKADKASRKLAQIRRQVDASRSLKRAQRYLGLRPRRPRDLHLPVFDMNTTSEEIEKAEMEYGLACGTILPPFDLDRPAPFPFAGEPIFICVDIEANERFHDDITEIGISVLDPLDLIGLAPGKDGENWISQIRSRHLRIQERSHVVNRTYLTGCPDKFGFGKSEFVPLKMAAQTVDECFQPPYLAQFPTAAEIATDGTEQQSDDVTHGGLSLMGVDKEIPEYKMRTRSIVFVGHDTRPDIRYLRLLGSTLFDTPTETPLPTNPSVEPDNPCAMQRPKFLEALDTGTLFRILKRQNNSSALGYVLYDLGINSRNLHNAGNDARYTLEAMVRIILLSRLLLDAGPKAIERTKTISWPLGPPCTGAAEQAVKLASTHDLAWMAEVERRIADSPDDSKDRIREECTVWAIATGWLNDFWEAVDDDTDGGRGKGIQVDGVKHKEAR
ncbi:hypothetical protein Egran_05211 [Elaphomyces granulatus]|uniref:Gfd2/YDR514C-like C-terminal domain-containing protein n=1 Tax=Elaphomyces granulatus TaxID=519963 RepID=A0A232LS83_9EURO|nr:hypothetical protein Egran_05211 [Elaphomyces granulatus]